MSENTSTRRRGWPIPPTCLTALLDRCIALVVHKADTIGHFDVRYRSGFLPGSPSSSTMSALSTVTAR